jgi:hypothetical protein
VAPLRNTDGVLSWSLYFRGVQTNENSHIMVSVTRRQRRYQDNGLLWTGHYRILSENLKSESTVLCHLSENWRKEHSRWRLSKAQSTGGERAQVYAWGTKSEGWCAMESMKLEDQQLLDLEGSSRSWGNWNYSKRDGGQGVTQSQ